MFFFPNVVCPAIGRLENAVDEFRDVNGAMTVFPEGYAQRSVLDDVARLLGRTPRVICEAESANFIAALVRAWHGIAFMFAAIAEVTTGIRAVPIKEGPAISITFCRVREQVRSLPAQAFYDTSTSLLPLAQNRSRVV